MSVASPEKISDDKFAAMWQELSARPLPPPAARPTALDRQVYVPPQSAPELLTGLLSEVPDQGFAVELLSGIHEREVLRSAQRPVINVTVTPPAGAFRVEKPTFEPKITAEFSDDTSFDIPVYRDPEPRPSPRRTLWSRARDIAAVAAVVVGVTVIVLVMLSS